MRIHIIGGSGTGKTCFAKKLCEKYHIPRFDLDNLFWDNTAVGYGTRMPAERRAGLLREILEQSDWIIEGVYYSWVEDCFDLADTIFVMDIPRKICCCRIVKRFIRRKFRPKQSKKESLKSLFKLLKWAGQFPKRNLPDIYKALEQYAQKVVVIHKSREIRKYLS